MFTEQLGLFDAAPVALPSRPAHKGVLPLAPLVPGKPKKNIGLDSGFVHPDVEAQIRQSYQAGQWCAVWAWGCLIGVPPWKLLDRLAAIYPGMTEAIEPQYVLMAAGWRRVYMPTLPGWHCPYRLPDGSELCVLPDQATSLAADLIAQSGEGIAFQHRARLQWREVA